MGACPRLRLLLWLCWFASVLRLLASVRVNFLLPVCTGCEGDGDLAWGGGPLGRRGVSGGGVGCIERGRRPGDEGRNFGILSLMNQRSFT